MPSCATGLPRHRQGTRWAPLRFVATGAVPHSIVASGHPTGVVFALDLTLLVPCFVMGGIWLWKRWPWGYVLGAIMSIKGATYTLALAAGSLVAARAGVDGPSEEIPLWLALSGANLIATGSLLGNMRRR